MRRGKQNKSADRADERQAHVRLRVPDVALAPEELVRSGAAANDFLGSQGDVWDTQSDMCLALIGAVSALVLLSALHDRGLRKLATTGR